MFNLNKKQIIAAAEKVINKINLLDDTRQSRNYHLVSAGLLNFLPNIPHSRHEQIFRKLLLNQRLSQIEQNSEDILEDIEIFYGSKENINTFKSRSNIFCTFHFGSYRLINTWLVNNNIPVTLVTNKRLIREQGGQLTKMSEIICKNAAATPFKMIDVEQSGATFQMIKDFTSVLILVEDIQLIMILLFEILLYWVLKKLSDWGLIKGRDTYNLENFVQSML